jgi:eukaryotic-like serine/threonine-protein kinase
MKLSAASRLGPYEILAPLGAGGMGEVYRARDTRLGRDVAIKVLPERLAEDSEALARFEREARAIAALSHPNILGIFDFGREGSAVFAVMELLEGSTLRDRLDAGALPFRKCVDYGAQIAEGLAAAHDKGIVHRDLKPENVFVTPEGRVKILDFGLAKSVSVAGIGPDTQSPTLGQATDPGTVLGTVGYMSPEQVRGRSSDARSDIFSFGSVMYEMATGKRPFSGSSAVETMNAVLKEDPPEISTIRSVPPEFERILRHCLEKVPEERFQSARDIVFALKSLEQGSSTRLKAVGGTLSVRRWALPATIAAAAVVASLAFWAGRGSGERRARSNPPSFQRLTFRRGTVLNARFATDGKTVVYCATWQGDPVGLFTVRASAPDSQKLDLPPAMLYAVSRSDELAIGLGWHYTSGFTSEATLARASLSGGAPRPVAERVVSADWAPDGESLAISRFVDTKNVLEYPIGHPIYTSVGWIDRVRVSPDGKRVAFADHRFRGDTAGGLVVVDRAGKATMLVPGLASLDGIAWTAGGKEILWSGANEGNRSTVAAVDLSGRGRLIHRSGISETLADVAPGGATLVLQSQNRREAYLASSTTPGGRDRDLSWLDWTFPNDISADGKWLLESEQGDASRSNYIVYLRRTDGSPAIQLGLGNGNGISPDGKLVVAQRLDRPSVRRDLFLYPTGAGQPQKLDLHGLDPEWASWFPDGKHLLLFASAADQEMGIYAVPIDGGAPRLISARLVPGNAFVSPDGASIAGMSSDRKLTIVPVAGGPQRSFPEELNAFTVLRWSADGRSVFYQERRSIPARIHRLDLASGREELIREIAPLDPSGIQNIGPLLITPDGQTVVYSYRRILNDLLLADGMN